MYLTNLLQRIAVRSNRTQPQQQAQREQTHAKRARRSTVLGQAVEMLEHRTLLTTVGIGNATATEGAPLAFTVSLDAPATAPIAVRYTVQNGTARVGTDYARTVPGTLTFAPGETTKTITVGTVDNNVFAADKNLKVRLTSAGRSTPRGTVLAPAIGTGTIINNDAAPVVSITPAVVDHAEGNRGTTKYVFTVSTDKLAEKPIKVLVGTQDVSATAAGGKTADYVALRPRTVVFSGKRTSQAITVVVKADTTTEANEVFKVNLSAPQNATLSANPFAIGVIRNDDGTTPASATTVSIPATITTAPGTSAGILVSLSAPNADPVVVNLAITPGTAVAGTDYAALSQAQSQVTIPAGQTSVLLPVSILPGATTGRTFSVAATAAAEVDGATTRPLTVAAGTTAVTIADGLPGLSVNDVTVAESAGTGAFTVTLAAPVTTQAITVGYTLAGGTATLGTDFNAASPTGTITFAPGETTKTIPFTIANDTAFETNETFTVTLGNPVNAPLTKSVGTATITDDDSATGGPGTLSVADASTGEQSNLTFTVALSNAQAAPVTVNYATSDGTAVAGTDYTATAGTLTFAPGETVKTVTVPVTNDAAIGANKTVTLTLSGPTGTTVADGTATGTIVDNDGVVFNPTTNGSGPGTGFTGVGSFSNITGFNYNITNNRPTAMSNLKVEFFLEPAGTDLSTATPYKVVDLADLAPGQTVAGQLDAKGYAGNPTGRSFTARLVSNGAVLATNVLPL